MRIMARILGAVLPVVCSAGALAAEPATQGAATKPSGDVRIYMDARINDQPVRLAFDTGAQDIILFRPSANRLKLKVTDPPPDFRPAPGKVAFGKTEECRLSIGNGRDVNRDLRVFDLPKTVQPLADFDGVLGWPVIQENIWQMQGNERRLVNLAELPKDIGQWTKYDLLKDAPVLAFRVQSGDGASVTLVIDTGDDGGVDLSEERWRQWRRDHSDTRATLDAKWMPATGLTVTEVCWAEKLTLGSFSITHVPVTQSPHIGRGVWRDYQASLGLFALTRLDVIADWKNGSLYVRPVLGSQWRYPHNRIGAVFVPDGNKGNDLVAHVADPSPAHEAGIRNGDALLKIDELDVAKWQTDPAVLPLHRFWSRPAGTKLRLMLKRDGKPFETAVELRDILQRESKQQGVSRPPASSSKAESHGTASRPGEGV